MERQLETKEPHQEHVSVWLRFVCVEGGARSQESPKDGALCRLEVPLQPKGKS